MKIKDIERTANVAWSPHNRHPILLAAATAAQQLDASFSTSAVLELYQLNLSEPGLDAQLVASVPAEQRFHKIVWGSYGKDRDDGTLVTGCDGGIIEVYDVAQILKNEKKTPVARQSNHKGAVRALDFNPFQHNLLATGAAESEIYIWDLNNTHAPMTPGAKSQPFEEVMCVAWNRQVQHILASTFATKCVVWDLRKNEPVIKLTDTVSRIRWKSVAWHPDVATQLCLASEDDEAPTIQLWDLRFATSPLKALESHRRGVLSIAWCAQDSNLLASCGKDNRIVCWNPNSNVAGGEVLSDIAKSTQWNFDVVWCPKNPALVASPSFDGHISVYSVMGGKTQQFQTTAKIADSFPGMDGYIQAPVLQENTVPVSADLSKAPKWLKRPVRCSFAFGGKLVTFYDESKEDSRDAQITGAVPDKTRRVTISQVITEPDLVDRSAQLQQALEYGDFSEYCRNKAEELTNQHKRNVWYFLKANLEENPRAELLNLLGYKPEEIDGELQETVEKEAGDLNGQTSNFTDFEKVENFSNQQQLSLSGGESKRSFKVNTQDDIDGHITRALLIGNVEAAVKLCLKAKRYADALIVAMRGGEDLFAWTRFEYLKRSEEYGISSLISALVLNDWARLINDCDVNNWKEILVAILTHSSDLDLPKLCESLGNRLEAEGRANPRLTLEAQLCYICAGSFDRLVDSWSQKASLSSDELQELVELVTFLKKAVERQGRSVEITGRLADLLSRYASILADQGSLSVAFAYLENSQNKQVASLRERLCVNLGKLSYYGEQSSRQQQYQHQPRSRHNSRHSFSGGAGIRSSPILSQGNLPYNSAVGAGGVPLTPPVNASWQQQQVSQQPFTFSNPTMPAPKTFSPPPPMQTARPPSVGGLSSRAKYVIDPSVQSGSAFTPRNTSYAGGIATVQPQAQPYVSANNLPPSQVGQSPYHNPLPSVPIERAEAATSSFQAPPLVPRTPVAPGWNDPPVLTRSTRAQQPKPDYQVPEPITHPLYGTVPNQNIPLGSGDALPNDPYVSNSMMPLSNAFAPQDFTTSSSLLGNNKNNNNDPQILRPNLNTFSVGDQQPSATFNQNALNSNLRQAAVPSTLPTTPRQQLSPAPPIALEKAARATPKLPLPEEYGEIKNSLDELKSRCICAANNLQTKRKLEDVSRKLESLYDALTEGKLSSNTLALLRKLIELLHTGDYPACLSLHTQMVSGPDFAQIATFMPGLKVLIQCALQLQVYLR